ncbi:MAG TPA: hypothetical protein VK281_04145 [Xanthobacteraceae bacterium]|nr:hypothetical protein [Xanthobacteraceae bacterium]
MRPGAPAVIDPRRRATVRGVAPDSAPLTDCGAAALLVATDGHVRITPDLEDCGAT